MVFDGTSWAADEVFEVVLREFDVRYVRTEVYATCPSFSERLGRKEPRQRSGRIDGVHELGSGEVNRSQLHYHREVKAVLSDDDGGMGIRQSEAFLTGAGTMQFQGNTIDKECLPNARTSSALLCAAQLDQNLSVEFSLIRDVQSIGAPLK
ncbi:MAG: hypothetical protein ABI895_05915 [Deltaproteobacteria bacterium]